MSWICPKCERELRRPDQVHYCIKVSVDSLLKDQSEKLILAFDKMLAEIVVWEGETVSCSKYCIVFVRNRTFFLIRPMTSHLELKFYSNKLPEDSIVTKSTLYNSRYANHISLSALKYLTPQVYKLIKESYDIH